jgi:hypothetical protein
MSLQKTEFVLYTTEDGVAAIHLRVADATVWLNQAQIAELFATTKQTSAYISRTYLKKES